MLSFRSRCVLIAVATVVLPALCALAAEPGRLTVKVDQPGVKISPLLYGLMTEEINHSYDGGLYAELIRNRAFKDDAKRPVHWSIVKSPDAEGQIVLDTKEPVNGTVLTTSLRMEIAKADKDQRLGIANDGYWGIPVKPHTQYRATFYAKGGAGFSGPLTVAIESQDGASVQASGSVPGITSEWKRYTVVLATGSVTPSVANRFVISAAHAGQVWLSLVSLFPPTYHDRPNGNRVDLMQKLADMHPAFLRLPGGNYLEGDTIAERFAWKTTLGDIASRPGHRCCWNYPSSDGMGLLEFLEWCEDLHIEPVLAVYAGYSLRGEHVDPGKALEPFVAEALEEIEYVTGDQTTAWGQRRAQDGHARPFPLRYVEIGNEDWFDRSGSYDGRYAQFHDAIKAKYPALQLIATMPVKARRPDVVDDHYYRSARAMASDAHHYDKYNRSGPKIFVGEWASTEGSPTPTLQAALGDAAWLTGMERNSDVVVLSCYAPLLVNVNPGAHQWGTNLIGYDALTSFGSPSYYVQKMFAENRGDTVLPVEVVAQKVAPVEAPAPHGGIGVGAWLTQVEYKDLKVTQGDQVLFQSNFAQGARGWKMHGGKWQAREGVLRQTAAVTDCHASTGKKEWTDYTYSLKARKTGGDEGFLILFHDVDRGNRIWWNIGGWGNTRTALEAWCEGQRTDLGHSSPLLVEKDRWYDIRIELKGRKIRCFIDDKLITEATDTAQPPAPALYATASRDDATGAVIVKVVNFGGAAQQIEMDLQGMPSVAPTAAATVLAGAPEDVNTVAEPTKVTGQHIAISNAAQRFVHEFPANSVSVLRFTAK